MLKKFTLAASLLGLSSLAMAEPEAANTAQPALHICAIKGTPDSSQFQLKKRIKVAKGTYGSVTELYPRFAERAHQVSENRKAAEAAFLMRSPGLFDQVFRVIHALQQQCIK